MNMLVKWNPVVPSIFSDIERAFVRNWLNDTQTAIEFEPRVDVIENKDGYVLRTDLPGVSKEDVKITLENGMLTLSGERRAENRNGDQKYHLRETGYGKFERRFRLTESIERNGIKASFKDGVLEIGLPKSKEAQSREIAINAN